MTAHPGFGSFQKEHKEFFNALDDDGWEAVPGFPGVETKVLSGEFDHENRTGAMTKVTRWAPGHVITGTLHPRLVRRGVVYLWLTIRRHA